MTDPNLDTTQNNFQNRELSWLQFNSRVLHEAVDSRTPLLERLKFAAIFSSNLDEFFMVRVAALKKQLEAEVSKLSPDGLTPEEQLVEISNSVRPLVKKQENLFEFELRNELANQGILLKNYDDLDEKQKAYLKSYFENHIFPALTPLAVDPSHPFPYISNLSLNLIVVVKDPETGKEQFARLKIPKSYPRFFPLPKELHKKIKNESIIWMGIPLEQIVAHNLELLFPGMLIQDFYPFRVTRNADIAVAEDEADDLLIAIEQELRKRRTGKSAVRLEIQSSTPEFLRNTLIEELELEKEDVYETEGLLALSDLMSFISLPLPHFKDKPWQPVVPAAFASDKPSDDQQEKSQDVDIFNLIRQGDILLHHPYQSFTATVEEFVSQAAHDPDVLAIKMTVYRTSGDSPIVKNLIAAADNGKQVVALVELKARFDEENNINWARQLEQRGVHVVYGLVGLKTHSKVILVVRQEGKEINRYVHIGTGNYNSKTANFYTDLGILSCRPELGSDLSDLFNFLTGYSRHKSYQKILVAPMSMRERMIEMIKRESANVKSGSEGKIIAKMNSLVDPEVILALYEASQAGVKIDLIVRGISCLRANVPGLSENIRVISIIGRFLEHSRIFYFHNGGQQEIYIGSADWMTRNLSRRVEVITPVEDPKLAKELLEILHMHLSDNRQAWEMQSDGTYVQRVPSEGAELSCQKMLMEIALKNAGN
jgi:polyphosphate kinase